MAHKNQLDFVATVKRNFPENFSGKRVLEIGSLDINGSIRQLFTSCVYTGIDVAPGPGVDIVCQGQDYDGPDDSFDTVISCEVMEHNPHWADTVRGMTRVCKPGGLVIVTCATLGRDEHGTTRSSPESSPLTVELGWNYYRNLTENDFRREGATDGLDCIFATNWGSYDLYMIAIKGPASASQAAKLKAIHKSYRSAFWSKWRSIRRAVTATILDRRN
jgi:SAM-dependent methyltransferase